MSRVLVVGSLNMDLVVATDVFPRPGETLFGTDFATHAGGKGANQAVAAAREAVRLGCAAGALSVTRPGARGGMPTAAELHAFLEKAG